VTYAMANTRPDYFFPRERRAMIPNVTVNHTRREFAETRTRLGGPRAVTRRSSTFRYEQAMPKGCILIQNIFVLRLVVTATVLRPYDD
jgi:hypothetical protein